MGGALIGQVGRVGRVGRWCGRGARGEPPAGWTLAGPESGGGGGTARARGRGVAWAVFEEHVGSVA